MPKKGSRKGAALVLGGGIAGIQAALDLAEGGIKVYFVEKGSAIGGVMAQLDKTFPTNDCSMCILSPKMVEAERHLDIELLTLTDLLSVEGKAGNFKAKIRKNARYVDFEKCKGCGDCVDACPVEVLHFYEENLTTRKAIYREFDQAVPGTFVIDKEGTPPCRAACPIHLNAHGYVMAAKAGEWKRAQEIVRKERDFCFAGTAARVCTHPCEETCKRCEVDNEPVAIRTVKRFVTDWEFSEFGEPQIDKTIADEKEGKVAVIGAGPAGLSAAFDLRKKGYQVKVFEALPKGGGMLLTGIPSYRLPRKILEKEVKAVEDIVDVTYDTRVDKALFKKLVSEYDAVFVAAGAHKSRGMMIPGEDLAGVYTGVQTLKKINFGKEVDLGRKVVVVGGGNTAMDAARSALRLGAEVTVAYRRSRHEMPAIYEEVEAALEEGVELLLLHNPVEFIGENGKLTKVRLIKMELGEPDESGRRRPVPIAGSEFEVEADSVLLAIGEQADLSFIDKKVELTSWQTVKIDELTLQSSNPKVFAGGDCVTGPSTFIEAVAAGKRAAISIDRFLSGKDLREGREEELPFKSDLTGDVDRAYERPRIGHNEIPMGERRSSFNEVELSPAEQDIGEEAKRCINCSICSECMLCVSACEPEAIFHDMENETDEIEVGAVIVAPGFDEFDAALLSEYGYGRYANVVTSIEFERLMSASGPTKGHILRPSDAKDAHRVAWIQCIGSRDRHISRPYCSSVCCMYATKEAIIAGEHIPDLEKTIFYMDLRAYGKDFDKYIERAQEQFGVRYVRGRVARVVENPETHELSLTYETDDGKLLTETFDMVVLSVGLEPAKTLPELAKTLGIELDEQGFIKTSTFAPVLTSRYGVFAAGAASSPKDIPESVAQASGAAGVLQGLLGEVRNTEIIKKELPPERDVFAEPPRVGVFICHCGINIGSVVNVPEVVEYAKTLPNVAYAGENLYTCSSDTQEKIKEIIEEHRLNRVVVSACTPRTHEPLFQSTIREAGLNKYLFEMANIRDQDSWVHMHEPAKATEKAKDLVRMAVAKASRLKALPNIELPVTKRALVIGGGVSGMTAARTISQAGFETVLIEKSAELGGNLTHLTKTLWGEDAQVFLKELIAQVSEDPNITIFKETEVSEVEGFVGSFKTTLSNGEVVEHGTTIIATGAVEYQPKPDEYLASDPQVVHQRELEEQLHEGKFKAKTMVMIQCVGSRNDEHPYCSRVCCTEAVKNALTIKERSPETEVIIMFRDLRTYGLKELAYEEAREKGVLFMRFDEGAEPVVDRKNGKLTVRIMDELIGREVEFSPDLVALSTGIVAEAEANKILAQHYKVPINEDGFFLEAHMKLRPVDFATDGVYLCGLAHAPKFVDEAIAQAAATAARALVVLNKDKIEAEGKIAVVKERTCIGCGYCVEVCPYGAIELEEKRVLGLEKKVAAVNAALCKGCGGCAASCRSNSIDLAGFTNQDLVSAFEQLMWEEEDIVGCCGI